MVNITVLILLSILSGILGRMGGADGFNTKWRDFGCPSVLICAIVYQFGFVASFWWVYLLIWVLTFGAMTTYWDDVFGYDNLWFSGAVVGGAILPIVFIDWHFFFLVITRTILLCIVWGSLNKFLPQIKGRDVIEEFSRYSASL